MGKVKPTKNHKKVVEAKAMDEKKTEKYAQNWVAYNEAKTREKYLFFRLAENLLHDACPREVKTKGAGRPALPLKDMLFSAMVREYSGYSSRRSVSELQMAKDMKLIRHVPHFNTITRFLRNGQIYPMLQKLIVISALPLSKVEPHVAVDSSGFHVSPYEQWMKFKWGSMNDITRARKKGWVKAHIACGTKTHVILSAEVTKRRTGDSPMFSPLFQTYARYFEVDNVSADKAYSSYKNIEMNKNVGITPFIMFKDNSVPYDTMNRPSPASWKSMYYYFKNHEEKYLSYYHKRSNVETTFGMVKKKFGSRLKSKDFNSQRNELLCRFLVHNITVLIQEAFELGIEIDFSQCKKTYQDKNKCELLARMR